MPADFEKTEIFISGIRVMEPVTMATDILVTIVCFYAYYRLRKMKLQDTAVNFMMGFFVLLGIATALGGIIGHSFNYALSFAWKLPGWLTSMVAMWLLERASIEYSKILFSEKTIKLMKIANLVELVTFMFLTFYFLKFRFVEIHTMFGLVAVNLPIHAYVYHKTKSKVSQTAIWGVVVALLSAIVFKAMIFPHQWFNHIDFSHVLMAWSAWIFYKAATDMRSKGVGVTNIT